MQRIMWLLFWIQTRNSLAFFGLVRTYVARLVIVCFLYVVVFHPDRYVWDTNIFTIQRGTRLTLGFTLVISFAWSISHTHRNTHTQNIWILFLFGETSPITAQDKIAVGRSHFWPVYFKSYMFNMPPVLLPHWIFICAPSLLLDHKWKIH